MEGSRLVRREGDIIEGPGRSTTQLGEQAGCAPRKPESEGGWKGGRQICKREKGPHQEESC